VETAIGAVVGSRIGEARMREVNSFSSGDRYSIVGVDSRAVDIGIERMAKLPIFPALR